jgi:hypothetical protein
MKKIYITLILLTFGGFMAKAQTVQRDKVVLEMLTGIGYFTGPGVQLGAEDLITNGKNVACIAYCNSTSAGDTILPNNFSKFRSGYYSPSAWVTSVFDGLTTVCCGHPTTSQYSLYLPIYNTRIAIPTNYTINLSMTHTGLNYNAHIVINKIGSPTATNLRLLTCVTQSNIAYNWYGMNHFSFVNRIMMPNEWGKNIEFCSNNSVTFDLPFTIKSTWPIADLELIAFVQDFNTGEIYQASKISFSDEKNSALNKDKNEFNLKVYKFPDSNIFTIAFDLKETSEVTVAINDIIGKNVFTKEINAAISGVNSFEFDASNLTPGNYLIKLSVNGVCTTKKLSIS